MRIRVAEQFARAFRGGVWRDWLTNRIVFAEWHLRVDAVDRRRRAEDKLIDLVLSCELEQVQRAVDVGFIVELRLRQRWTDACACGEMNDAVECVGCEGLFECGAMANVS